MCTGKCKHFCGVQATKFPSAQLPLHIPHFTSHGFSCLLLQGLPEVGTVSARDAMDDGSPIVLSVTIDRRDGSAVFDFEGTGETRHTTSRLLSIPVTCTVRPFLA
jgi:hypothetical protein